MLRRLAFLLLSVSLLFTVCACVKQKAPEQPITTGFECDVDVRYKDMNVKGHLTRSSAGSLRLDVTEPATLNGLSMEWTGDSVNIKLHGLTFGVKPESIPQSALGKGMLEAFDAVLGIHDGGKITGNELTTKGKTAAGDFEIISDPSTGKLLSLSMPSSELSASFSNFTLQSSAATKSK